MANLPVRQLGAVGVITDANPYDLPSNAFSSCANVVFDEDRVQRSPVFKQLFNPVKSSKSYDSATGSYDSQTASYESAEGSSTNDVRFVASFQDPSAGETVLTADRTGVLRTYPGGSLQFATPAVTLVTNDEPWSHAQVAGKSFLARKDMVPYVRWIADSSTYSNLGGDWPVADKANVVRGFLDYCVLLGVEKSGIEYPTMVKWSNPIGYADAIADIKWDPSNPNYVAGENVLGDLKTPIRDGLQLGNVFIIYAQDQVWLMEYTGSSYVFNFRRLFPTGGIINTNCVVEIEGKHYVFGESDIYVHDGNSKRSLADGRIRRFVYQNMDRSAQNKFFTVHDSVSNLIYFCYKAKIDEAAFTNTEFCNRAAVYNYMEDTWSFMDMPNVVGGSECNVSIVQTIYSQLDASYELYNTSYASFTGATPKLTIMMGATDVANGLTESRVYALDLPTSGLVNLPINMECTKEAWVQRIGVDLDETGSGLKNYKIITCIVPQAGFESENAVFNWKVGSTDLPNTDVTWYSNQNFDPQNSYQLQMKVAGRYLAYRIGTTNTENFKISGFDAEIKEISRR